MTTATACPDPSARPTFMGKDIVSAKAEDARFHVISAPYEKTVSYGKGTAGGPAAIIAASLELETFDGVSCPADAGIHTVPEPVDCSGSGEEALDRVRDAVARSLKMKAVPLLLGGEHTVSYGAFMALKEVLPGTVGVIQFDAHADLRDRYENSPLSHACVMRRAYDLGLPFIQVGVRSLSLAEHEFRKAHNVPRLDAADIGRWGVDAFVFPPDFPEQVYLTFDVDALDPSIMPATGTPEPGGMSWFDVTRLFEAIAAKKRIVGADIVELAPIANLPYADFTAARLLYNLMGYIARSSATGAVKQPDKSRLDKLSELLSKPDAPKTA